MRPKKAPQCRNESPKSLSGDTPCEVCQNDEFSCYLTQHSPHPPYFSFSLCHSQATLYSLPSLRIQSLGFEQIEDIEVLQPSKGLKGTMVTFLSYLKLVTW